MDRVALFDFDGTLLPDRNHLFWHFVRALPDPRLRSDKTRVFVRDMAALIAGASARLIDKHAMYRRLVQLVFEGVPVALADEASTRVAHQIERAVYPRMRHMLRRHAADKRYLVTANCEPIVAAFCDREGLGCIATRLATEGGCYTGQIRGEPCKDEEKVRRIHHLALGPVHMTAYGNSSEDLPLLRSVHVPVLVNPDARLSRERDLLWARRIFVTQDVPSSQYPDHGGLHAHGAY